MHQQSLSNILCAEVALKVRKSALCNSPWLGLIFKTLIDKLLQWLQKFFKIWVKIQWFDYSSDSGMCCVNMILSYVIYLIYRRGQSLQNDGKSVRAVSLNVPLQKWGVWGILILSKTPIIWNGHTPLNSTSDNYWVSVHVDSPPATGWHAPASRPGQPSTTSRVRIHSQETCLGLWSMHWHFHRNATRGHTLMDFLCYL